MEEEREKQERTRNYQMKISEEIDKIFSLIENHTNGCNHFTIYFDTLSNHLASICVTDTDFCYHHLASGNVLVPSLLPDADTLEYGVISVTSNNFNLTEEELSLVIPFCAKVYYSTDCAMGHGISFTRNKNNKVTMSIPEIEIRKASPSTFDWLRL